LGVAVAPADLQRDPPLIITQLISSLVRQ